MKRATTKLIKITYDEGSMGVENVPEWNTPQGKCPFV